MKKADLTPLLDEWILEQKYQEYAENTLSQYRANVNKFLKWLPDDEDVTKDTTMRYKAHLHDVAGSTRSINTWIVELNKFLKWADLKDCTVKKIKMQVKQSNEDVLSLSDYKRMLRFAKRSGDHQLYMIMKILAQTGIRISELKYFTVENLDSNYIKVFNKGKERRIILRQDLKRELKHYCRDYHIRRGVIFPSPIKSGQMIATYTIWRHMKKIAGMARVNKKKAHAHSFRHLFAQIYMEEFSGNVTELADILGHNSLETTRLYSRTSDAQKREHLERLKFG